MRHTFLIALQIRRHLLFAFVCVLWLALGGVVPAQAAAPTVGALAQELQPARLLIPSLEIDAPIEAVGQDESNFMAAPSTVAKVAWYNLGPRPGETGNAVMAGHLDDVKGRPAVFWKLDELEAGDEIVVRFGDKSEKRFEVMTVEVYDADAAPLERIFGVDFERDLNLITCDGEWNAESKLYERRLVVYARLIRETATSTVPENSTVATTNLAKAAASIKTGTIVATDEVTAASLTALTANETALEYVDDATQTTAPSTLAIPPSPRSTHARQNRQQSLATH